MCLPFQNMISTMIWPVQLILKISLEKVGIRMIKGYKLHEKAVLQGCMRNSCQSLQIKVTVYPSIAPFAYFIFQWLGVPKEYQVFRHAQTCRYTHMYTCICAHTHSHLVTSQGNTKHGSWFVCQTFGQHKYLENILMSSFKLYMNNEI